MAGMRDKVTSEIIDRYACSVPSAAKVAPQTVEGWGDTKEHGGVSWSTYRATGRVIIQAPSITPSYIFKLRQLT